MPEGAPVHWSAAQQSMLRELGCELFTVRRPRESGDPDAERNVAIVRRPREGGDPGAERDVATVRRPREGGDPGAERNVVAPGFPPSRERRVLVVHSPDSNWLRGSHAKLARSLLAALGIPESQVRGEAVPGAPALAFGIDAPDAVRAPTLEALRDGRAKRALWPALRALRRRLRDADSRR